MAKRIIGSTPKADGYRMPAEFEPQDGVWMLWPERNDNWRSGAKPAQETFCQVARAIARFEKVTMCVSAGQYQNARARLPEEIRVVEVSSNDAWVRDCGPTFLVNGQGGLRAVDWTFNAWGGLYDGLYFPWDRDDQVAQKICEMADVDSYRTEGFVLEGGSIHVDGEGTLLTTEMCLLSAGRFRGGRGLALNIPGLAAGAAAGQGHALFPHFPLLIFHDGLLVIGRRLPLYKGDGPRGAGGQAVAQAVAVIVPHQLRLAVHHGDGALVTGGGAGAAAVAFLPVDFNDPSFHDRASLFF